MPDPGPTREVWDLLLVNDELDMLEVRLGLLQGAVTRVVVVEGDRTFQGTPKRLHVTDALAGRLAPWADRLTVVPVAQPTDVEPWQRERLQRKAFLDLVRQAPPGTVLVCGDVDELPDPDTLTAAAASLSEPVGLEMGHAVYYANWVQPHPWRLGSLLFTPAMLDDPAVQASLGLTTEGARVVPQRRLPDGGWHLSWLGGPQSVGAKLAAYSHTDFARVVAQQPRHVELAVRYGVDLSGYELLTRQRREDLSGLRAALLARHPEFFNFDAPRTRLRARAYAGYAHLLHRRSLPGWAEQWLGPRPWLVVTGLAPLFVAVELTYRVRRKVVWLRQRRH